LLSSEDGELNAQYFGLYGEDGADVLLWHAPNLQDIFFTKSSTYHDYVEDKYRRGSGRAAAPVVATGV
jgi:hypothetical protein